MNKYILLVVISLISGVILGYLLFNSEPIPAVSEMTIISDTIYKEIPAKPIIIEKVKAEKEYIHDTLFITQPFIAQADTIIQKDTILLMYTFPDNYFSMQYLPNFDTIAIPTQTIIKMETRKREWWEIPAALLSGCAIGMIINEE